MFDTEIGRFIYNWETRMILRNFLYLDTDALSNYLSTLEGYSEVEVDETQTENKQKGGKVAAKVVEGSGTIEESKSTKRKLAVTPEAQFQRLYEILEGSNDIQYLDGFDKEIWDQLYRGEIIEVQARIKLPETVSLLQDAQSLKPFLELMKMVGQNPLDDPQSNEAFIGMTGLSEIIEQKPVPIFFEALSTKDFKFFASLRRQFLQCEINDLQGEALIFGKIHRFIEKGNKEEVFSIMPEFQALTKANRKQRRSAKKANDLTEVLRGPAAIIIPTAIYI